MPFIHHYAQTVTLYEHLSEHLLQLSNAAIEARGGFHWALAGGNTPRGLYEYLATGPYGSRLQWSRFHLYFGDERYVSHDHPDSNYHMVATALSPLPQAPHIYPMPTDSGECTADARDYDALLSDHLPRVAGHPCFDLILLGMGGDGHTASLFPGTDILHETQSYAAAVYVQDKKSWRISLTLPTINNAGTVFFLVTGKDKADIVRRCIEGDDTAGYPAQLVAPMHGELHWYVDDAAAAALKQESMS